MSDSAPGAAAIVVKKPNKTKAVNFLINLLVWRELFPVCRHFEKSHVFTAKGIAPNGGTVNGIQITTKMPLQSSKT
jgi:hypothetical protein